MYKVPIWDYLQMVGKLLAAEYLLQNQRVDSGEVIFSSAREIARLRDLIEYANNGELPVHELNGAEMKLNELRTRIAQSIKGRKGKSVYDIREFLVSAKFAGLNDEGEWWTSQCPMCALQNKDRTGNNLHFHSGGGFGCFTEACDTRAIYAECMKMANEEVETPVETESEPETEETPKSRVTSETKHELGKGGLATETKRRETSLNIEEIQGGYQVIETRKDKETGEVTTSRHTVPESNVQLLWDFICEECEFKGTLSYYDIREYLMLVTGYSGSEDAWAGGKNRTKYFFPYHYYPLKVLEVKGAITYGSRGDVSRRVPCEADEKVEEEDEDPPWVKAAEKVLYSDASPKFTYEADDEDWKAVTGFFLDEDNSFIAVYKDKKGWMDVGGKREDGESDALEVLGREAQEEACLDISNFELVYAEYIKVTKAWVHVLRAREAFTAKAANEIEKVARWPSDFMPSSELHFRLPVHIKVLRRYLEGQK